MFVSIIFTLIVGILKTLPGMFKTPWYVECFFVDRLLLDSMVKPAIHFLLNYIQCCYDQMIGEAIRIIFGVSSRTSCRS